MAEATTPSCPTCHQPMTLTGHATAVVMRHPDPVRHPQYACAACR